MQRSSIKKVARAEHSSALNKYSPIFKRKLVVSALSIAFGSGMFLPDSSFAAETVSVADLQAENARLKQELEAIKKGLQSKAEQPVTKTEEVAEEVKPEKQKAEFIASDTLDAVIVTSRNRAELAQDIPLPVRVLGGERLDREDIKTIWDLQAKAPNLQLNPAGENARKVSPGIRGLGRGGANDSMEQSVGVIVDGVSLYYSGQAWSDYVDLDRIEVLYGPQGTLIGKNTSLGAINIITNKPSFTPSSKFEITTGELNTLQGKFSATGPLVDGLLAYRGTFLVDRQDGLYENTYQSLGKSKETWREANKIAGRVQLLWTPTENLTGRFIADKLRSDERVNTGNVLASNGSARYKDGGLRPTFTPINYTPTGSSVNYGYLGKFTERSAWFHNANGSVYQPKIGTTDIENSEARPQITNQYGVSGQFDWHVADHTLTSITAYRYQDFDIKNGGQFGQFYVGNGGQQLWNDQFSQELRIASDTGAGKFVDYQAGLYYLNAEVYSDDPSYYGPDAGAWNATSNRYTTLIANAPGRELLRASLNGMYQSSVTDAKVNSKAAYASADWHVTDRATVTTGVRYTAETKTNKLRQELDRAGEDLDALGAKLGASNAQVTAAKATRAAQINNPFGWVKGNSIDDDLIAWNLSPSFKITDDTMVYGSVGRGIKSGFIYFTQGRQPNDPRGIETDIKPEKTLDYELGFKSLLLGKKLQLNANLFRTEVTDYQASWTRTDPADSTKSISGWGNAPKVLARGIELEANYRYSNRLDFNLAAGYSKSTYEDEWLVQKAEVDLSLPQYAGKNAFNDAKGQQIANIPKVTINYGANYQFPVGDYLGRITLQNTYRSSSYFNDNHADFTYQKSYNVTSLGLGLGALNKKWELSVIARNIFDTEYATGKSTWGSTSGQTLTIGAPKNWTATFKYNL